MIIINKYRFRLIIHLLIVEYIILRLYEYYEYSFVIDVNNELQNLILILPIFTIHCDMKC